MNQLLNLFFALTLSISANASQKDFKSLISQIKTKIGKNKIKAQSAQILKFTVSPNAPKVNEAVTLFLQPLTQFTDSEIILEGTFDSADITPALEHPTKNMWIYNAGAFSEIKDHLLQMHIFIQDINSAQLIKDAITNLDSQIAALDAQIANAVDPAVIAQLTADRNDKASQRAELILSLASLKSDIGTENFSFSTYEDTTLADYPKITQISPNAIQENTVVQVKLTGSNFGTNPEVRVAGQTVALINHTTTEINFTSPSLAKGIYDVEVRIVDNGQIKNVISKNGLIVSNNAFSDPNAPPVALVTPSSAQSALGTATLLSAINSYDPNKKNLRWEWKYIAAPDAASGLVTGSPFFFNRDHSFNPIVPGLYVLELKVIQTEGALLTSLPANVVINVAAPANRAPTATAPSITTAVNTSNNSQIAVTDPDFWQNHSYVITKQSQFGTASVSTDGLVTFTATQIGFDTITVTVLDSGTPYLSTTVSIPVNVVSTNQIPTVTSIFAGLRSAFLPANVVISPTGLVDPDGTIVEVKYLMGDGTVEKAPVSGTNLGFVSHNYQAYGSYNATMIVTDNLGGVLTYPFTVNVVNTDIPKPVFSIDKFSCSVPCTINANASNSTDSTGITQYRWLWGDGSAEESNGTAYVTRAHTFSTAGTYRIRLRVRDQYSAQADGFATVYVGVTAPVTGSPSHSIVINTSAREVLINTPVSVDASRSFDPNPSGAITGYLWNLGPCASGACAPTTQTASATYTSTNIVFNSVKTTNALGGVSTSPNVQILNVNQGHAPIAILKVNGQYTASATVTGVAPLTLDLNGQDSYDYDGSIVNRSWSFGDGTTDNTNVGQLQKTYSTPGTYQINLTITDNDGNKNAVFQTVVVTARLKNEPKNKITILNEKADDIRHNFARACAMSDADACSEVADTYRQENQKFIANGFYKKACGLGLAKSCGKK